MNVPHPRSPEVLDAYIETIETGDGFVVVQGWLVANGAAADLAVEIGSDRGMVPIKGYFDRPDIAVEQGRAYGFMVDFAYQAVVRPKSIFIISCSDAEYRFSAQDAAVSKFQPRGAFDPSTVEYVAGWIYDPALWHSRAPARPTVQVGDIDIPVEVSYGRPDLPFASAIGGRKFGFNLPVGSYRDELAELSARGADRVHWTLSSGGMGIAELVTEISPAQADGLRGTQPAASDAAEERISAPPPAAQQVVAATGVSSVDSGYIDYWSYSPRLQGWIIGGWAGAEAFASPGTCKVVAAFGDTEKTCEAMFVTYERPDIAEYGIGFVMYIIGDRFGPPISSVKIVDQARHFALRMTAETQPVEEAAALQHAQLTANAALGRGRDEFLRLVNWPIFDGSDTIGALGPSVQIGIDEVIFAPDCGVVLIGWLLDPTGQVKELRIRNADHAAALRERWVSTERNDIKQAFGPAFGLTHAQWGFTAFAPLPIAAFAGCYLEVQLSDGRVGYRTLPAPTRSGVAAINRILHDITLTADNVLHVCQDVLSRPVLAINRARIKDGAASLEATVGQCPDEPRASIIVPLYGRLDFLSYQMALFDRHEHAVDEFIYVLDQPERKEEIFDLARIAHTKTGIPFRLILPSQNLGFAGASNLGLKAARGDYICFLNSDVIPKTKDWMAQLIDAVEGDGEIGIASPLMLFEDETVQHAGMDFERMQQFGNMLFPFHPGKGQRPGRRSGIRAVPAVTGACMVMERQLCLRLGGFDEDYVVGDFEDADLCMKVRAAGLRCAVVSDVVLYHLERQSQTKATSRARMNLTLLNGWTFAERWDPQLVRENSQSHVLKIA